MFTDVTMSDLGRSDSGFSSLPRSRETSNLSLNGFSTPPFGSSNGIDEGGDSSDSDIKIKATLTVKKTHRAGKKVQRKKRQDARRLEDMEGCYQVCVTQVVRSDDNGNLPVSRTVYSDGSERNGAANANGFSELENDDNEVVGTVTIGNVYHTPNDTGLTRGQGCQMPLQPQTPTYKQNGHNPYTQPSHHQCQQPESFRVDVLYQNKNKVLDFEMPWSSTVDDLKRQIHQETDIVPEQQKLKYSGKPLYEDHKLTSYDLDHYIKGNQVQLMHDRSRGG